MDVDIQVFFFFFARKWAQGGARGIISEKRKLVGNGKLSRTTYKHVDIMVITG